MGRSVLLPCFSMRCRFGPGFYLREKLYTRSGCDEASEGFARIYKFKQAPLQFQKMNAPIRRASKTGCFEDKLDKLIEENGDVISWGPSPNGNRHIILVRNNTQFSSSVLPKYFRHAKFSSFVRQLNSHGFVKSKNSPKGNRNVVDDAIWEFEKTSFRRPMIGKSLSTGGLKKSKMARQSSMDTVMHKYDLPAMSRDLHPIVSSTNVYASPLMSPIALPFNGLRPETAMSALTSSYAISGDQTNRVFSPVTSMGEFNSGMMGEDSLSGTNFYPSPEVAQNQVNWVSPADSAISVATAFNQDGEKEERRYELEPLAFGEFCFEGYPINSF